MELALKQALKKYFGHSSFRPYQKEAIQEILKGRDALIVMATGSGKSICYQLPPLITRKTAVVISPLISLMQDQVMSLQKHGIRAQHLSSAQASHHTVISNAEKGEFDIIYMTPERACSIPNRFWSKMMEKGISLLAIDEAHCISEWGHDFREEYKKLDTLRPLLPFVPFVALTATATKKVQLDIMESVKFINPYKVTGSFDRSNLYYGVRMFSRTASFREDLVREIAKDVKGGGSTIVYCPTIKDAEEVFESLRYAGIEAGVYHGEMLGKDREFVHRSFVKDELRVMVATVAFGMGIDKPNIRCVIHYGCPKSLESYYQESGRCGRDGLPSKCWLYYTRGDFGRADFYTSEARTGDRRKSVMESFIAAQRYCNTTTCRRKYILEYFGEEVASDNCGNCDNCTSSADVKQRDMAKEVYMLLTCIHSCGGRWGFNVPIDVLRGSRNIKVTKNRFDELPLHGMGKDYSANWWKALGDELIVIGYLNETVKDKFRTISVSNEGQRFLELASNLNQAPLVLPVNHEMLNEENRKSGLKTGKIDGDLESLTTLKDLGFSETEAKLYDMLLRFRADLARNEFIAPYVICGEKTLQKLAKIRPSTMDSLRNIDGINQHLLMRHGGHILQTVKHLSEGLELHLDGEFVLQPSVSRISTSSREYKATYGSVGSWRMWQEGGLSCYQIANLPGRPFPIKEDTVVKHIVAAARLGHDVNWIRLFKEIGYTQKIAKEIQVAFDEVGSKEKLKPILECIPEFVSYAHLYIFLGMEKLGLSFDEIIRMQQLEEDVIFSKDSLFISQAGYERKMQCPIEDHLFKAPNPSKEDSLIKYPWIASHARETIHRNKTEVKDSFSACENSIEECHSKSVWKSQLDAQRLQVTKDILLSWLRKCDGASISQVSEHFPGSSKVFIGKMLLQLESEGLIYNKNGMYKMKKNDFYTDRFNIWE